MLSIQIRTITGSGFRVQGSRFWFKGSRFKVLKKGERTLNPGP
jgi:hypothetical protein